MNYIVIDIEKFDYRSTPELFDTLQEAIERCEEQNARYGTRSPYVVKKLTNI